MKCMNCSYSLSQRNHKTTDLIIAMIQIVILCDKSQFLVFVFEEEHLLGNFSSLSPIFKLDFSKKCSEKSRVGAKTEGQLGYANTTIVYFWPYCRG